MKNNMLDNARKQTVLVIDDSPIVLRSINKILLPKYNVKVAKDGKKGLALAQACDIDLILLDIIMPGMSGFDVLAALKGTEMTKSIPVIFITGSNDDDDEVVGLSLGAVDYIRKPIKEAIVLLRVGMHLQLVSQMRIIEQFSLTDGLTGIYNRRNFDQQLAAEWNRAIRGGGCLSVLMLDIDRFKSFNDTYGHINGDLCLRTIAAVLKDTVARRSDFVFRWGGEEFAVLLPETQSDGAKVVAEQIRKKIAVTPIPLADEAAYVTVSIGVSCAFPKVGDRLDDFMEVLDKALYAAKKNGRNRVSVVPMTTAK